MKIKIDGLLLEFPRPRGTERPFHLELYLPKKRAQLFMKYLESQPALRPSFSRIDNVSLIIPGTSFELKPNKMERQTMAGLWTLPTPENKRLSQISFTGDEQLFRNAWAGFVLQHGCTPEQLTEG